LIGFDCIVARKTTMHLGNKLAPYTIERKTSWFGLWKTHACIFIFAKYSIHNPGSSSVLIIYEKDH
jgi:hypothetical protein